MLSASSGDPVVVLMNIQWNLVQTTCLAVETASVLCRRGGVTVKLTVKMALMNKTVVSIAIGYLYRQKPLRKSFTCTNCLMTMKEIMRSGCFFLYVCYCQYATRQLRKEQSCLVSKALYVPLRT